MTFVTSPCDRLKILSKLIPTVERTGRYILSQRANLLSDATDSFQASRGPGTKQILESDISPKALRAYSSSSSSAGPAICWPSREYMEVWDRCHLGLGSEAYYVT